MAENSTAKQRQRGSGRPFPPGTSGNPAGKPRGTRHRLTILAEQLLHGEAEAIVRKAIRMAKAGDTTAIRLCLERVLPSRKQRAVTISLPPLKNVGDLPASIDAVIQAIGNGDLTPEEGQSIVAIIEAQRRAIETTNLDARIRSVEERLSRHGAES